MTEVNPYIFRGYDLRGLVDKDLNPELAELLGKVHGTYMKRKGITQAVVGHDCRATSPEYSEAIIRGLNWAGIDVVDIGMVLVGTFYWAQYFFKRKGGVFVTASHNPAEYNGFKFAIDFSNTLVSEGIQELRRMVEEDDIEEGETKGETTKQDIMPDYTSFLKEKITIDKKFKVVVDASMATAGPLVPNVLRSFGCEVIESNCEIDSSFPLGTPDPTETIVAERVKEKVLETGADLGFSFDADGDRIGVVDDKGNILWNDILVALFAIDVLQDHPNSKIMYNTLCSKVVDETIREYGGEPFMWRVGHSFLKAKNREVKATMIGELSGHFFFSADFYNHDDGTYSALRVLNYLSRTGKSLSEEVEKLPKYISSPEIKLHCDDDKKVVLMEKLAPILAKDYPSAEIINDERAGDGVRLEMEDRMFVVRYSQNGPYITIKFEAKTQEDYESLKAYIRELLKKFEEVKWEADNSVNIEALRD